MKHLLLGFLIGVFLSAAGAAGFTYTYLRDSDGWEIITAEERSNLESNFYGMLGEIMRLRMMLAKGGCT